MKDSRFATPLWNLPLRRRLLILFVSLAIVTTAISTLTLTILHTQPLSGEALLRREVWISASVGALVTLCALLLAGRTSRRMSRRLVSLWAAANRVAAVYTIHPPIDDQAKDQIGELARSFNVMVEEINRLSGEYDRLALTEKNQLEALVADRTQELMESR